MATTRLPSYSVRTGVHWQASGLDPEVVDTGATVASGSALVTLGLFFCFGLVLGAGYHWRENLFVPLVGHALYNGVQVLLRAVEVAA